MNTKENMTTQKTNETKQAYTYLGDAEYFGKTHLYDGNFDPKCEGAIEEVVAYLESLLAAEKASIASKEEDVAKFEAAAKDDEKSVQAFWDAKANLGGLTWEGNNGTWYEGEEAVKVISSEIAALKDGSHSSLRAE